MADIKALYETIKMDAFDLGLSKSKVPEFITDNLRYELFDWQREALENFLTAEAIKEHKGDYAPTSLLFNLATGTGKTLLMAALIIYYYEKGYRNFIFFVNQNNIVGKTEDNLTDPDHNKYLFSNPIVIDKKTVNIKKVDTFSNNTDDIEIHFTSIHKLHNAVYQVKENSVFLDDLQQRDIVMLADEAHHLNSATKAKEDVQTELDIVTELADNASAKDVEKSWEHTVNDLILHKGDRNNSEENKNVLLEFTATVPTIKKVEEKYLPKTIIRFELKDFLKAGYTKEINLVSSSFNKKLRVLQALIFNWYRYKMGVKHNLPNFKPVILFRSKFVTSKREENVESDYEFFREIIDNLTIEDFKFLQTIEKIEAQEIYEVGQSRIVDIRNYIADNDVSYNSVISYLKDAFNPNNCIITHSSDKTAKAIKSGMRDADKTTPEQDKLLNSLEDKNNPITAIFTCQRLTEGWDVLNLFDIVRMYEGQNTGGTNKGKAGGSTTSEVQLIGRGVRYYPFKYEEYIPIKRKFDKNLDHELRVLEEFYFHSDKDERYIAELKKELKRQELLPGKEKQLKIFDIKPEIKKDKSSFYNTLNVYTNEKVANPNRCKRDLEELKKDWNFEDKLEEIALNVTKLEFEKDTEDVTRYETIQEKKRTITLPLNKTPRNTRHKALSVQTKREKSILRFNKLKEEINIECIEDAFKDEYFGSFNISVVVPENENLKEVSDIERFAMIEPKEQVRILTNAFNKLEKEIELISNPHIGTEFKPVRLNNYYKIPKPIYVVKEPESETIETRLKDKDWYPLTAFYGTSEERELVKFLENKIANFEDKFKEVNLLRNEEVYKIHDFKTGRGFMPDFILFLKSETEELHYQVFIEPKGNQFKDASNGYNDSAEGWKQEFLDRISQKYSKDKLLTAEDKNYKLIGLPLYNKKLEKEFKESTESQLDVML
jgi:type III restriction enzyme